MSEYEEFVADLGERILDGLYWMQSVQLDAVEAVGAVLGGVSPPLPGFIADRLPAPQDVVRANFALAQRLLESQRAFALQIASALAPQTRDFSE